jgi:hypothetical protein
MNVIMLLLVKAVIYKEVINLYLEICFINNEKKTIKIGSFEEGLSILTDFKMAKENDVIEIMSNGFYFSFIKHKVSCIEFRK